MNGVNLQASINGDALINYSFSAPEPIYTNGFIAVGYLSGFGSEGQDGAYFDNVKVYSIPEVEQEILNYISIMPCRIVDTRKAGGAFTPDEIRSYNVWGDVVFQGGNPAGCPSIWGEPRAVFLNVIAVPVSGQGNIIAYPFSSAAPTASLVNWRAGEHNIGGTGPVKTCYNCDKDISIKSRFGTTHVVIDVFGYYE